MQVTPEVLPGDEKKFRLKGAESARDQMRAPRATEVSKRRSEAVLRILEGGEEPTIGQCETALERYGSPVLGVSAFRDGSTKRDDR